MNNIAIHQITHEEFHALRSSLAVLPPPLLNANDMAILQALEDFLKDGEPVYGAFESGQLIGLVRFGEEEFHLDAEAKVKETLIGILFVHPLFRDRGIGMKLVDFARSQASTPFVLADPMDEQAHKFFAHCGFKPNHLYDLEQGGDLLMISKSMDKKRMYPMWYHYR